VAVSHCFICVYLAFASSFFLAKPPHARLHSLRGRVGPNVVDHHDARMIQYSRGALFLLESPQAIGVFRKRRRQNLDRYVAAQPRRVARRFRIGPIFTPGDGTGTGLWAPTRLS
jgi:hypothetical protein